MSAPDPFPSMREIDDRDLNRVFRQEYPIGDDPWSRARLPKPDLEPSRLERVESMVRELLDIERRRELHAEYERLTRGWRP